MTITHKMIAAALVILAMGGKASAGDVRLYSWSDYFGAKSIETFTAASGTKVTYDVFDSNDLAETKLLSGKSGYDVVTPNLSPHFARQLKAGLWAAIDQSKLKNISNADPAILAQLAKVDPGNAHGVPWMWGTTGIIFNTEKIKAIMPDAPVDSLRMLFDEALAAKFEKCGIAMLDDGEQVLGSALIYLGKSVNTATPADIDQAVALIEKIRPHVRKFHSSEYVTGLASGEFCLVLGFSGDAHVAALRSAEGTKPIKIEYRLPREGALVYFDVLAVPSDAPDPAEALTFIDFLLRPEIAAAAANDTGFATANAAALKLVAPEIRNDPNLYPNAETIAKLILPRVRTLAELRQWQEGWNKAKGQN